MASVRVMLVEDSRYTLTCLQALLKRMPDVSVVATARDGVEALPLIQATEPQVLILDIKMPKMNGLELLDELRKMNSPVEVIVLSFHQEDIWGQLAREKGAVAYVPKDNGQLFLDTLQQVIGNHASR